MPEVEDFLPIFPEEDRAGGPGPAADLAQRRRRHRATRPGSTRARAAWPARCWSRPRARWRCCTTGSRSSYRRRRSPLFAWGAYLDQWALALGTERLAATYADGTVRFTAPEGTIIPAGTEVGLAETAASDVSYLTQADVTVAVGQTTVDAGRGGHRGGGSGQRVGGRGRRDPVDAAALRRDGDQPGGDDRRHGRGDRRGAARAGAGDLRGDPGRRQRVRLPGVGPQPVAGSAAWPSPRRASGPGHRRRSSPPTRAGNPVSTATRTAIRDYLDPVAVDAAASAASGTTITVPTTAGFRPSGIVHLGTMANERIHNYTGLSATQFTGVTADADVHGGRPRLADRPGRRARADRPSRRRRHRHDAQRHDRRDRRTGGRLHGRGDARAASTSSRRSPMRCAATSTRFRPARRSCCGASSRSSWASPASTTSGRRRSTASPRTSSRPVRRSRRCSPSTLTEGLIT